MISNRFKTIFVWNILKYEISFQIFIKPNGLNFGKKLANKYLKESEAKVKVKEKLPRGWWKIFWGQLCSQPNRPSITTAVCSNQNSKHITTNFASLWESVFCKSSKIICPENVTTHDTPKTVSFHFYSLVLLMLSWI